MRRLFCSAMGGEFTRQREHDMYIACGQQFSLPRLEPAQAGVAPGIVGNAGYCTSYTRWHMSVGRALIAMSTQRGGFGIA